ncbi:PEP/pyruvate-binding domain-containing protein [Brevibacterium sp. RIT 803]|uniref:PEP/pyruvate-binding domain-containing protein n=1 Tax=Brevibacterium sp. RIT 803 TaxID=2810210 RepID=UPI0020796EEB|nr:PEP/pyruvate-binding domain-containing protein [Brevibacterium sp. RIT 803]
MRILADAREVLYGGKARSLARLLRAGLPVPDGFVVQADCSFASQGGETVRERIDQELSRLGDPAVAVRSSAADEDTAGASGAGMYDTVLGVRGIDDVCAAIASCRRSADSARVRDYRRRGGRSGDPVTGMAVLVQVLVEAEVSGVMFTPLSVGEPTRIESSWGLGSSVVNGELTPDAFEVGPSGAITAAIGVKDVRTDAVEEHNGTKTSVVAEELQTRRTLDDETLRSLKSLGVRASAVLGGPLDIEWAIAGDEIWIIQSRPVTAPLPAMPAIDPAIGSDSVSNSGLTQEKTLDGTPGSHGVVTAPARIVSGLSAFSDVKPGEVVICSFTDPSWTPLFTIAGGVVTEVGGALSHAAIVAREYGIPAVLGVTSARARLANGDLITIDGTAGTITMH